MSVVSRKTEREMALPPERYAPYRILGHQYVRVKHEAGLSVSGHLIPTSGWRSTQCTVGLFPSMSTMRLSSSSSPRFRRKQTLVSQSTTATYIAACCSCLTYCYRPSRGRTWSLFLELSSGPSTTMSPFPAWNWLATVAEISKLSTVMHGSRPSLSD
jgi:hypothetical protein